MTIINDILLAESLESDARLEALPVADAPAPSAPTLDASAFDIPFLSDEEAAEDDALVAAFEDAEFGAADRSWASSKW